MLVDAERVLLDLKRHIASKSHHGQRELLAMVASLEGRHRIEESLPERALRLYGLGFYREAVANGSLAPLDGFGSFEDSTKVRALRGDSHHESEEAHNAHNAPRGNAAQAGCAGAPT